MDGTTDPGRSVRALGASPGHLLALIRSAPAWTRQQLLDATGMSRPTLLERMSPLFAAGLVREAGTTASVGGRPAQLIQFDDRHLGVLTFDVGHTHGWVSLTGVHGRELRSSRCALDITGTPPDRIVRQLTTIAERLTKDRTGERIVGVGVGLPGPIDPATGLPGPTPIMPGWDAYPVLERLRQHWDVPMVLENDARALVFGEAGQHDGDTLLGVKWATGIGAGLIADGRSIAGDDGAAGDIGHIKLTAAGPPCRCGRRGCLAAHASGHALLGQLAGQGVRSLDELARRSAEPEIGRALDAAARKVGTVLASLIAMANPRTLVLGGIIGSLPRVVDTVAARVREIALDRSTEGLRIVPSRLGERAATAGLVHLVVTRVLAPDAIDRALADRDGALGPSAG
ncbi:ROK family protein [Dactylosporangium sp. NPDC005572]|uniref:ROK family protein n=1 Tax=Dactylosporangium sp. NPDC005572 TaxID=3156889 RepID=UPI0033A2F052